MTDIKPEYDPDTGMLDCKNLPWEVVREWMEKEFKPTLRRSRVNMLGAEQKLIEEKDKRIAELEYWINIAGGISCPNCENEGGYYDTLGKDCQCQFCCECPDSLYNRRRHHP